VPSVEKVAMDFAASVAKMRQFPEARIEDLKTAIAEACINAIEHGNKMDASEENRGQTGIFLCHAADGAARPRIRWPRVRHGLLGLA